MKYVLAAIACAALIVSGFSPAASAAQIVFQNLDEDTQLNWSGTYGSNRAIYWDLVAGKPDPAAIHDSSPAFVGKFNWEYAGGSGGGGGGDTGDGESTGKNYNLELTESKTFQFTSFFYDQTFGERNSLVAADLALKVRLIDPTADDAALEGWHDITVAQLAAGVYLSWQVSATAGETITTQVLWQSGADGTDAAGFFMDNVADIPPTTPEPATMGLLGLGLVSLLARRRK